MERVPERDLGMLGRSRIRDRDRLHEGEDATFFPTPA